MHMCIFMKCMCNHWYCGIFLDPFVLYLLRQGILLKVRLANFCSLASQIALRYPAQSLQLWDYRRWPWLVCGFWRWEFWFPLPGHALYPLSHLPSPLVILKVTGWDLRHMTLQKNIVSIRRQWVIFRTYWIWEDYEIILHSIHTSG